MMGSENYNQYNQKRLKTLQRTAKEVKNYKVTKRLLITALILLLIVLGVIYAIAALYKKTGSFTVSLDKYDMTNYKLTLLERKDAISSGTSYLNTGIVKDITNIAEDSILKSVDDHEGGEHNGDNYIAYTFFLKNAGENVISYEYAVLMSNISNNIDEAIRVKVYVDGTPTTYAKAAYDGNPEKDIYGNDTTPFVAADTIAEKRVDDFAPGSVTKFTIVVWIEGNDRECQNYIIGGEIRIDMKINVVH